MSETDAPAGPLTDPAATDPLAALLAGVRAASGKGERAIPPVERWNPPDCGDIGMEIRADGSWWHQGTRIGRQPLVDLFATVLRKDEDGRTWLVTPGEKVIVHVEDAHFRAIRVDRHGEGPAQIVSVLTNVGDLVALGPHNPLRVTVNPVTREPRPYVLVRGRLEALMTRAAFYELVGWSEERDGMVGIWSQGRFFAVDAPV